MLHEVLPHAASKRRAVGVSCVARVGASEEEGGADAWRLGVWVSRHLGAAVPRRWCTGVPTCWHAGVPTR